MRNEEILKKTAEGIKESNKILIRELVRDLEEKGIAPAWAIDGKIKKLEMICESELKSFEQELKKFGMKKSDFCLLKDSSKNSKSTIKNIILVHKKSAKLKTYKTKNKSWMNDLHHDLETKFFIA